jgi:hypothetical protein
MKKAALGRGTIGDLTPRFNRLRSWQGFGLWSWRDGDRDRDGDGDRDRERRKKEG